MEKATIQTARAGQIIRHLRDFIEKRESSRSYENLNKVVEEALALGLVGSADTNVKVHLELDQRHSHDAHRQDPDPAGPDQPDPQCDRGDAREPEAGSDDPDKVRRRWRRSRWSRTRAQDFLPMSPRGCFSPS
jgi:hypothetical protein